MFVKIEDFVDELCKGCKNRKNSVGYKGEKICEKDCHVMTILKQQKKYKPKK